MSCFDEALQENPCGETLLKKRSFSLFWISLKQLLGSEH